MSMRGMPQLEHGGKMSRGSRKFTGMSVIIGFVPVYAPLIRWMEKPDPGT
jgi:hypothetical protein